MKEAIYEAMESLAAVLKEQAPKDAVSCEVFINSEGYEWRIKCRSPQNLQEHGLAMKNLAGEWVK